MSEILGTLVKTSLVDYPGRVAAALFLCGCNLRCPYCYNALLVRGTLPAEEGVDFETVISYLERRRNVLSGFVISGGEPLLCPRLPHLIALAKS
ncbi:MAG: 4Fe-4S cluster-binding domain-containing protein, partial [Spirochaetaceae bacterium]|nr:4Fe-4S cluster-binding domain-containing protein [Spirochaetaceae bacterium]